MTVDATSAVRPGLVITGEYVDAVQEGESTGQNGKTYPGRYKVGLLVGRRVVDVEYRTEDVFLDHLADLGYSGTPQKGDMIALPVGVRSAQSYTFYFGRTGNARE